MDELYFDDALTGHRIALRADGAGARVCGRGAGAGKPRAIFFPGCSLLTYAPALAAVLGDYLAETGIAEGVSLLCCGKILDFEEGGTARRAAADGRLRAAVAAAGVERIVAACPNCAAALTAALAGGDGPVAEVVPLPAALAQAGCAIDPAGAAAVLAAMGVAQGRPCRLWVHDSCPDRGAYGFGRGVRALLPPAMLIDENRAPASRCCGSTARAAGRVDAALSQGARRAEVAASFGADGLLCACMSCAPSLALAQDGLPVVHYLELLCEYPLDWRAVARPLAVRFLLEDGDGPAAGEGRSFIALGPRGEQL